MSATRYRDPSRCYASEARDDANARLIAAAPDLLEACESFVKACDSAPPIDILKHLSHACVQTRAAIARATDLENEGWKDGLCQECQDEIEREEIAREEAADSRMRDDKAFRDEP